MLVCDALHAGAPWPVVSAVPVERRSFRHRLREHHLGFLSARSGCAGENIVASNKQTLKLCSKWQIKSVSGGSKLCKIKKKLLALIGLVISIQLHFLKIDELECFFPPKKLLSPAHCIRERLTSRLQSSLDFFYLSSFSFPNNAATTRNSFLCTKNMIWKNQRAS